MKKLTQLLLLLLPTFCFTQSDIALGEWASHLPYNIGHYVTQSDEKVYYGTPLSIFTIDKEDNSIEFVSKVEGLSQTGIQDLEYDPFNNQLIIAYDNSVFDIVSGADVFSVNNIKETDFIQGDKLIYDTYVQDAEFVYFATGFGVVEYNLERLEFGFTLDAQQKVSSIDGNTSYLIIAAANGAYTLETDEITPNFFGAWTRISSGLPGNYQATDVLVQGENVYLSSEDKVYHSSNFVDFTEIYAFDESQFEVRFLENTNDGWMLGLRNTTNNTSKIVFFDDADIPVHEITDCTNRLREAVMDAAGAVYIADDWEGIRIKPGFNEPCEVMEFNSPKSEEASDIDIKNDVVYVASGGVSETLINLFGRQGYYIFEDGEWTNFHENNTPFMKQNDLIQCYKIAAHPTQPLVYVGTFWVGLIEYNTETEEFILYDKSNSGLTSPVGDNPIRVKISGLAFDDDNNLWISNFDAVEPLAVYTADGTWHSFPVPSDTKVSDLVVDDSGLVWVVIGGNQGGIVVYDPGESIADPTDNPPAVFKNQGNSEIPTNIVNSVAVDLDGSVWVGTGEGVVVFECGSGAIESECVGNKRKVLQDSIAAFLLQTEDVLSIAVDGANRKWFGTRNGVFVQSPSGEEQIAHFDIDNSPLFDNTVNELTYNERTGEMFIATNKGMQSYRTETTGARVTHQSNVYAFPNPVRPDYTGPIAIKGLARDAEVKITDIDGHLVFQTEALGGQAIWDGNDINGRRVSGGVYLVWSSSSDSFRDPDTHVTKILLVR